MALADRAELVARLSLKDDFSGKLRGVEGKLGSLGRTAGRAGKAISVGLGAGLAVGAAVTTRAISSGLDSLAQLESATTSVDAAIKQMGMTGKVTSGQIATWANEIEASVGAAFDDKAITAAATTLIRYGKVTTDNLRPALVVMTDLAAKTGDVDSAASLLAKALADPTKAAGKLARQGIILTKAEQDQIKALVKAGKVGEAQALVLDALAKSTKGAAAASQGPYARSIATLKDAWEDATRALAVGFLPILEEVRDLLSKELAKPETLNRIRDFGKGLAGGLKSLIDAARNVPWQQVGDAMKLAGQGAKAVYDLFTGLPPWVQTAVLTGWGLNKITGGVLGGIVGELGKGLIKGVLGMNAAVVNINAANVNGGVGGGGVPVGAVGAAGSSFLLGTFLPLLAAGATVTAIGMLVGRVAHEADPTRFLDPTKSRQEQPGWRPATDRFGKPLQPKATPTQTGGLSPDERQAINDQRARDFKQLSVLDKVRTTNEANRIAIVSATRTGDNAIVSAIRGIQPPKVIVNVSQQLVRTTITYAAGGTVTRSTKYVPVW